MPYLQAIHTVKRNNLELRHIPYTIVFQTNKYSNTNQPVLRFVLNHEPIPRNNDVYIGYTCLGCGVHNEITLNLYLRKVRKQSRCCNACKNMDVGKREEPKEKWSEKPLSQRVEESEHAFLAEDSEFQSNYFQNHMTRDEFVRVRSKLLSVGNGKRTDIADWEYVPYYRIWNQTRYTPMLIHRASSSIEKPSYVQWRCEGCESLFTNRDLEVQKNRLKILCADCGFCNRTFKVRTMSTPWDAKVRYQSVQEKRWVEWCVEQGIRIVNGPNISYEHEGEKKKRTYKVDFQIPSLRTLIEIKDNHIWHKRQIENGKWGKKEDVARQWCDAHGWTYTVVFPKTLSKWKEDILVRYSLTLQETVRSKDKEPCENIGGNL